MEEVIIVGAGLSGLAAAYYLKKKGVDALVLEARDRWGGRIETILGEGNATPVEMGATWFTDKHMYLMRLLKELEVPTFKQFQKGVGVFETDALQEPQLFQIPDTEDSSYRIAGGTATLTNTLAQHIGRDRIVLGSPITRVTDTADFVELQTSKGKSFTCRHLVITIPPFLILAQKIVFDPLLPDELTQIMGSTHTWMGDSIKFAVEYDNPFWRKKGYSGTVFSHAGIALEMYDHTNLEETQFALKGFLTSDAFTLSKEERELKVIEQLTRLLGYQAANYLSYSDRVWRKEAYTFSEYEKFILPHQNNGHPLYTRPLMSGKLHLAGTETSPLYGGYMDGAVYSGLTIAQTLATK